MTSTNQDKEFRDALVSTRMLEEAIDWIRSNLEPDDVFTQNSLEAWAENNGYVRDEQ